MQKPKISSNNVVLAEQRRASKEITQGIEKEIDQLHILSGRKRVVEFFFFFILYSLGALLIFLFSKIFLLTLMGILFMGIALNSLAILIHEGLHGLLAKNTRTNHLFSFLVGLPIMISATAYQTTHNNHHYELGRKLDYGTYRQHVRKPFFVWVAYFAQLTLGTIIYILLIPFLAFRVASNRSRFFIILEYIVITTVLILFLKYVSEKVILLYWIYPLLIMSVLTNVRGIASHALGDVENIYLSSRTIKSSKLMSFLFMYENYHLEHHLFPIVPSYNLSELHSLIWDRLPQAVYSKSYLHFLFSFLKAAFKNDLKPMGVVSPRKT